MTSSNTGRGDRWFSVDDVALILDHFGGDTDRFRAHVEHDEEVLNVGRLLIVNAEQAATVAKLVDLFGAGDLRPHDSPALKWVWFRSECQDWLVNEKGRVQGWNDLSASELASVELPDRPEAGR